MESYQKLYATMTDAFHHHQRNLTRFPPNSPGMVQAAREYDDMVAEVNAIEPLAEAELELALTRKSLNIAEHTKRGMDEMDELYGKFPALLWDQYEAHIKELRANNDSIRALNEKIARLQLKIKELKA
jgi:hypothetical protein